MLCPSCRTPGVVGARYCMKCGERLPGAGWRRWPLLGKAAALAACVVLAVLWARVAIRGSNQAQAVRKFNAAAGLIENRRWSDAIKELEASIALDPSNEMTWYAKGRCLEKSGDDAGARRDYLESIRLRNDFAKPHLSLARQYQRLRMLDEAVEAAESYLRLRPDDAEGYFLRGLSLLERGDREAARRDCRKLEEMEGPASRSDTSFSRKLCTHSGR